MSNPEAVRAALAEGLRFLYGERSPAVLDELLALMTAFQARHPVAPLAPAERLTERDAVLITYGDQVSTEGEAPLATLHTLLRRHLQGTVNTVHLLPFFPYTSDDGFSVVDYRAVDPALGSWDDVARLGADYRLMFDAVVNHASASSRWFQGFLADEAPYRDYFITEDPATDLSMVVRPRTTPLLTPFETAAGTRHVWTTFSADQVDLNYEEPRVLLEVTRVLLDYVERGADIIRLDAVTYLWKEVGTSSVHHPKTHGVLRLFRTVMEAVAPRVVLLTETNVPHQENISYFGDGLDEAQMVYNFALPPLVLHAFLRGDGAALGGWAATLATPSDETTFFNFLASHDGVGVRPVEALLPGSEVDAIVDMVSRRGGFVSKKTNSDGSESPYELNINVFDALTPPGDEPLELQVRRFLSAQAIMLALAGVPGIYAHSLLGSRGSPELVARTGRNRSVNRARFDLDRLETELAGGRRRLVLDGFRRLLGARRAERAFHPQAPQRVLASDPAVFVLLRGEGDGAVACLTNLSDRRRPLPADLGLADAIDLLPRAGDHEGLEPFETRWLSVRPRR